MSKLFKISGYFEQDESWDQLKPAFTGEIVVNELSIFWGCCKELGDGDTLRAGATSYLAGGFLRNRDVKFYFYKMYDNPPQDMLLCMITDLEKGCGVWATPEKSGGNFIDRNYAKIEIEELPYSYELEQKIKTTFNDGCPVLTGFPERLEEETRARRK